MNRNERIEAIHNSMLGLEWGNILLMSESAFDVAMEQMPPDRAAALVLWEQKAAHKRTIRLSRLAALAHDDPT